MHILTSFPYVNATFFTSIHEADPALNPISHIIPSTTYTVLFISIGQTWFVTAWVSIQGVSFYQGLLQGFSSHLNHFYRPVFPTSWSHLLFYFLHPFFSAHSQGWEGQKYQICIYPLASFCFSFYLPASGKIFSNSLLCTEAFSQAHRLPKSCCIHEDLP